MIKKSHIVGGAVSTLIVLVACASIAYAGVGIARSATSASCDSGPAVSQPGFDDASSPETTTTVPCTTTTITTTPTTSTTMPTTCTQVPVVTTAVFTGVAGHRFYGTLGAWTPSGAHLTWTLVPNSPSFSTSAYKFLWKGNGQFSLTLTSAGTPISFRYTATSATGCTSAAGRVTVRTGAIAATLAALPNAGGANLHTRLVTVGSSNHPGTIYLINFGDKTSHVATSVGSTSHTYVAARHYVAVVAVVDAQGHVAKASISIDTTF